MKKTNPLSEMYGKQLEQAHKQDSGNDEISDLCKALADGDIELARKINDAIDHQPAVAVEIKPAAKEKQPLG